MHEIDCCSIVLRWAQEQAASCKDEESLEGCRFNLERPHVRPIILECSPIEQPEDLHPDKS